MNGPDQRAPRGSIRRLGVIGGTFDPIHLGHLIAASEVLHARNLDLVLFVPTGEPWQKTGYSDPEDRFMMCALGAGANTRFAASRVEIDRRGATYTADTLQVLKDFYGPETELSFIVGADAALRLGTWRYLERVADLADVIAVTRPGSDLSDLSPGPGWPTVEGIEMPDVDISSTDIRERVRAGRPIDHLVPDPVRDYIQKRGLYVGDQGMADAS
jgi:nicotinate-nucleotide adenylyltransferase